MNFEEFIQIFGNFNNRDSNEINNLIDDMLEIQKNEPILKFIKKGAKSIFVGDIHGDYKTLLKVIKTFFEKEFNYIIFLGDYIDRGYADMQIKTLNIILHLKKIYPDKVIILRGNHEWRYINAEYGFKDAILYHLNPFIYYRYNELFEELPVGVLIKSPKILGVHGGIPISENSEVYSIKDISKIPKKLCFEDKLAQQLLWNDPSEKIDTYKKNYRGLGYIFGKKPFKKFMKHNDINYCIRSHEIIKSGVKTLFNNKLISIFTSKSYNRKIKPHILIINKENEFEFKEIK